MSEELNVLQQQLAGLLKDEKVQPILNPKYELEQAAQLQEGLTKKLISELSAFGSAEGADAASKGAANPNAKVFFVYLKLTKYFSQDM
jgi:hypothetical protein